MQSPSEREGQRSRALLPGLRTCVAFADTVVRCRTCRVLHPASGTEVSWLAKRHHTVHQQGKHPGGTIETYSAMLIPIPKQLSEQPPQPFHVPTSLIGRSHGFDTRTR